MVVVEEEVIAQITHPPITLMEVLGVLEVVVQMEGLLVQEILHQLPHYKDIREVMVVLMLDLLTVAAVVAVPVVPVVQEQLQQVGMVVLEHLMFMHMDQQTQ